MGAVKLCLRAILLVALSAAPATSRESEPGPLDPGAALERAEAAIGTEVGSHVLIDWRGEPLPLATLRGRPLVISLIYTSCSSVCPATTQHLIDRVEEARQVFGQNAFSVLSVGFDARRDTPTRLSAFAAMQDIDSPSWRLASADADTLGRLLDELGFSYAEAAGGFVHLTQTTIIDAKGRIYRQIYGEAFPSQVFLEPLKELIYGTTARFDSLDDVVDRIRFLCTVYNPGSGAYEFEYAYFVGMAIGGSSLVITGLVIYRLWRNNRRLIVMQRR